MGACCSGHKVRHLALAICHYLSLSVTVCHCLSLSVMFVIVCHCMSLYVIVCHCMSLYVMARVLRLSEVFSIDAVYASYASRYLSLLN
jgi:hypothetical protein